MTNAPHKPAQQAPQKDRNRIAQGLLNTIPIMLVGSMAMSLNLSGGVGPAEASPRDKERPAPSELGKSIRESLAAAHAASTAEATSEGTMSVAAAAPATYRVVAGDSVSAIAGRFGLATASVLALNGLGWKSVIFPGQELKLTSSTAAPIVTAPAPTIESSRYKIVAGDTIGTIAAKHGVSTQSILTANGLGWSSIIYAGSSLAIPGSAGTAKVVKAPIAAPAPAAPTVTPPSAATSHLIASGETLASIAAGYGVSIQSVLNANGLSWSSIIYSGRSLVIPGVASSSGASAGVTPLTTEMAQNARTIISVGSSLGVNDYGLVIALATAMQESSLKNVNHGDRDSLGLFQQRPSTGWGTAQQVTDPVHASKLFFGGPSNPNAGLTRGLLDIPGWKSKTVAQAAQAVQISAHPDAYAKWEVSAWAWLDQLT